MCHHTMSRWFPRKNLHGQAPKTHSLGVSTGELVVNLDIEAGRLGFILQLYYLLAVQPWAKY